MHPCIRRRTSQSPWVQMWHCPMPLAVSRQNGAPAPFCMRQHARTLQVWFTTVLPVLSTGIFLLHLPSYRFFHRRTHLPWLLQHSRMHCETYHGVQAREVHSLEDRQGPSCPSATSINSRTGPPLQVHTPTQVFASVLDSFQGRRTTVHLL